ncbi:hypothetical protein GCM10027515_00520 [Schumannella luteola]|uniref:TetR/AcrR family transcriptional regulator n=1 Tax=Schumannella luteola TaxID=472059 RepID=A0A852YI87_9MICO|nr:TetR/AcrR family transcriptional regulator C-terminal domain-containing protein [Schumannella luteola]NYG98808.1 hypothetical protein [Schumannella luteola]
MTPAGRPRSIDTAALTAAVLAQLAEHPAAGEIRVVDVARRLEVNPATVYRAIDAPDDLTRLALDDVLRDIHPPELDGDDWRSYLDDLTWQFWHALRARPGVASLPPIVPMGHPPLLEIFGAALATLEHCGFSALDSALAVDMVIDLAIDSTRSREQLAARIHETRRVADDQWMAAMPRVTRDAFVEAISGDPSRWFGRKLQVALDGIGHVLGDGDAGAGRQKRDAG